jgi:hypothetical protein
VLLNVVCVMRGGTPSILYRELDGAGGYSWRKDRAALPLHGAMPPPVKGEARQRWQGCPPLGVSCSDHATSPLRGRLWAGSRSLLGGALP